MHTGPRESSRTTTVRIADDRHAMSASSNARGETVTGMWTRPKLTRPRPWPRARGQGQLSRGRQGHQSHKMCLWSKSLSQRISYSSPIMSCTKYPQWLAWVGPAHKTWGTLSITVVHNLKRFHGNRCNQQYCGWHNPANGQTDDGRTLANK